MGGRRGGGRGRDALRGRGGGKEKGWREACCEGKGWWKEDGMLGGEEGRGSCISTRKVQGASYQYPRRVSGKYSLETRHMEVKEQEYRKV